MISTVVGSFPVDIKKAETTKDKILNVFGAYDPYKAAIKEAVISQLDAGVDIVSDGQVRGDMVTSFTQYIPGMKMEYNSTVITSKIRDPIKEITVNDLKFAKKVLSNYYDGNIPQNKGIKGIVTGPSTIVYSSRIESFYKNKDDAIIDLAHSLKKEVDAISKVEPKYIQIDEPFLSTGMVNMKTAREAISILTEDATVPMSMHVCGTLNEVFKELATFNLDILDFEFAGNDVNLKVLEDNINLVKDKKIGFGCLDTSLNEVDSYEATENLVLKGIELLGKDNILLDPDCGLRKASKEVAVNKLKLMNQIKSKL